MKKNLQLKPGQYDLGPGANTVIIEKVPKTWEELRVKLYKQLDPIKVSLSTINASPHGVCFLKAIAATYVEIGGIQQLKNKLKK